MWSDRAGSIHKRSGSITYNRDVSYVPDFVVTLTVCCMGKLKTSHRCLVFFHKSNIQALIRL